MINIVFEGSPGAGKSTIIKILVERFKKDNIKIGNTIDIDSTTPLYPILHSLNNVTPLVTDTSENFCTLLYETFVQAADYVYARERIFAENNFINIFDRSYFSIYAYQKVLLEEQYGKKSLFFLNSLLNILKFENKNIDIIFYFPDEDDMYLSRAEKRDKKEYSNYEKATLNKFAKELTKIIFNSNYNVIEIKNYDLNKTVDEVYKEICKLIRR